MSQAVKELAVRAATEVVAHRGCQHDRRCGCSSRWRGRSWLVIDALLGEGWTLTPPPST